jgi:phospholipid/cholesterol/gamma-HCH transport system substrate-binding protein
MKRRLSGLSPKALGILVIVIFLIIGWAAFEKSKVGTLLSFGQEHLAAEFSNRAKLIGDDLTYDHVVKLNGVVIGKVTTLEQTGRGTMIANMLVDPGTREKLGSTPNAFIIPTLATDGVQYLGLETGGDPNQKFTGDLIPLERTKLPVYLDDVLGPLSGDAARQGTRAVIGQTNDLLRQGGTDALRGLAAEAPATLRPAGDVLGSFRGTQPDSDLTDLVRGFESVSAAFNQQPGQFSSSLASLDRTTAALAEGGQPFATGLRELPESLRVSEAGFRDLRPALHRLRRTSEDFRPSARELDDFLHHFGPVIDRARPVIHDLRDVLHDLRPLVHQLPDTAYRGNQVLDDIKGNVFNRVNGPIKDRIYAPFVGRNEYTGSSNNIPLYQELGYFISAFSSVFQHYDGNNAVARLEAGGGGQTIGGGKYFPRSVEQYLESFGLNYPVGPNPQQKGILGSVEPNRARPQENAPPIAGQNSDLPHGANSQKLPMFGGTR